MNTTDTSDSGDPRIQRTRALLQRALSTLLESQSFTTISITDICKEADIARVTFYQHYESKEALLLAGVADFFTSLHQSVDQDALSRYLDTGELSTLASQRLNLADPPRVRLVGVALQHTGSAVRELTLASFLDTYSQRETELSERETQVLATFYIGGMLTLLEQFLNGPLDLSPTEFQRATLTLLRALRQGALQSDLLHDPPQR